MERQRVTCQSDTGAVLRAGMFSYSLAFLCGVVLAQQQASLFDTDVLVSSLLMLAVVFACFFSRRKFPTSESYITLGFIYIVLIYIGFIYASLHANHQLSQRLPERYAGVELLLEGIIDSVPVSAKTHQRFELSVSSLRLASSGVTLEDVALRRARLSWYRGETINAGERWQFRVRLKPPHGFMNPGGFDYEAWLFQQRIGATGYVRKADHNRRLHAAPWYSTVAVRQSINSRIDRLHLWLTDTPADRKAFALIKALATGDKSDLSSQQWQTLAATGTSHLMAISGLHIGLAAFFAFIIVRRLVPVCLMKRWPAQNIAWLAGLVVAILYALIAGLSIPTQRAIIMLTVLVFMQLFAHHHRPLDSLGFAIVAVLLFDPQAVLSAGFWFSFAAVSIIFLSYRQDESLSVTTSSLSRVKRWLVYWLRLQLMISVFLLPLSLYMFQQASLVSPLVNLVLIPYVSFIVVPLVLFGIVTAYTVTALSDFCFIVAAQALHVVWPILDCVARLPFASLRSGAFGLLSVLSVTLALLILINFGRIVWFVSETVTSTQRSVIKVAISLLSIVLMWPIYRLLPNEEAGDIAHGDMHVAILDAGQGSAAVIETRHHVAVFDAGARLSDKLDIGSSVIMPYLRWRNRVGVDRLIISHGDSDHIGGAPALLEAYPDTLLLGQDIESLDSPRKRLCHAGQQWHWDGVTFSFLAPVSGGQVVAGSRTKSVRRNNHSCVLKVESHTGSILFTGDIEKPVETQLLSMHAEALKADVLIVPHHGSKTSSSADFIEAVDPELAIISAGYRNRYRLPAASVVHRYRRRHSDVLVTGHTGALLLNFRSPQAIQLQPYRELAQRYWHHIPSETLWTRR